MSRMSPPLFLNCEHGGARHYLQSRHLGQHVEQLLGHAVGEVLLLRDRRSCCRTAARQHSGGRGIRRGGITLAERRLAVEVPAESQQREYRCGANMIRLPRGDGSATTPAGSRRTPRPAPASPGNREGDQNEHAQHPWRCVECRESDRYGLDHQPRDDHVSGTDLVDLAALEFVEEGHSGGPITRARLRTCGWRPDGARGRECSPRATGDLHWLARECETVGVHGSHPSGLHWRPSIRNLSTVVFAALRRAAGLHDAVKPRESRRSRIDSVRPRSWPPTGRFHPPCQPWRRIRYSPA